MKGEIFTGVKSRRCSFIQCTVSVLSQAVDTVLVFLCYTGYDVVLFGDGVRERRRIVGAHQEPEGRSTDGGSSETFRPTTRLGASLHPWARHRTQVRGCHNRSVHTDRTGPMYTSPAEDYAKLILILLVNHCREKFAAIKCKLQLRSLPPCDHVMSESKQEPNFDVFYINTAINAVHSLNS